MTYKLNCTYGKPDIITSLKTIGFVIFLLSFYNGYGGVTYWTGSSNTEWNKSANWSNNIPGINDTAIFKSSVSNNPLLEANKTIYRLVFQADTLDLGGYTLQASNSSSLSGGRIINGTIELRGASVTFSGTVLDVLVSAVGNSVLFNGSTFNYPVVADITGFSTNTSSGGNVFYSTFSISNSACGEVNMASTTLDIYHGDVTISDTGSRSINMALYDTSRFNGNIYLNSSGSGITFGNGAWSYAKLATGKTISVGTKGFVSGTLVLGGFLQTGETSQNLTLTGNAVISIINSNFNGTFNFSSPGILVKTSTFNNSVYFTKTDSIGNVWYGGNTFNGVFRFTITSTNPGSSSIQFQSASGDVFNDSATFNTGTFPFKGNISGTSSIFNSFYTTGSNLNFSTGGGTYKFTGTVNQILKGSMELKFKYLTIDKSNGTLTLQAPVGITGLINLTKGIIISDTTNLMTIYDGASTSNASNNSFISGPVKKIGSTSFTFPIGKNYSMSVVGISSSSAGTDSYQAEYFDGLNPFGNETDSILDRVSNCGYWKIDRVSGTSNVKITLGWDTLPCHQYNTSTLKIGKWNGSLWGHVVTDAMIYPTNNKGTITTTNAVSSFGHFIVSNFVNAVYTVDVTGSTRTIEDFYGVNLSDLFSDPDYGQNETEVQNKITEISASTARYYSGIPANWWDWRNNKFMFDHSIGGIKYILPEQFHDLYAIPNGFSGFSISDYYSGLYNACAKPFFCLNALSSDQYYQTALLYDAAGRNLSINLLEFGNELYSSENYNVTRFPSGKEYADLAIEWMETIRGAFPTFNGKIGLCAYEFDLGQSPLTRGSQWNKNLFDRLDAVNTEFPDAIIIHKYFGAGLATNNSSYPKCGSTCTSGYQTGYQMGSPFGSPPCTHDMQYVFRKPFREFFGEQGYVGFNDLELDPANTDFGIPSQYDIWITEHNSNDVYAIFHGSWAHGLTAALNSMLYLESDRISKVSLFSLIGDAIYSCYFGDVTGFDYEKDTNGKHKAPYTGGDLCNGTILGTKENDPTAVGYTIGMLAKAARNASEAQKLTFSSISGSVTPLEYIKPGETSKTQPIYGWRFKDDVSNEEQAIILNLGLDPIDLDLSTLPSPLVYDFYEQIYCDPAAFITGFTFSNPNGSFHPFSSNELVISSQQSISGYVTLQPYSILRLYKYTDIVVKSLRDDVCNETTSSLIAYGVKFSDIISWTCNNSTNVPVETRMETPTGATLTFDVQNVTTQTNVDFVLTTSNGTYPYTIQLMPNPILDITVNGTNNPSSPILLCPTVGNLTFYSQSSSTFQHFIYINSLGEGVGETDATSTTLTVTADKSAEYIVYTFDGTCGAQKSVNILVNEIELGDDVYVCSGDQYSVTPLQVPVNTAYSYIWSSSQTIANPTFTVSSVATPYTVTVTYWSAGTTTSSLCSLTDDFTLLPVNCCPQGSNLVLNNISVQDPAFEDIFSGCIGCYAVNTEGTKITIDMSSSGGLDLVINGRLSIDGINVVFKDCNVIMSEGSEILVSTHYALTLDNAIINPCSLMWKGVHLTPAGKLITQGGSRINGSQYAVYAGYRSKLDMGNTYLEKNYISIYAPPASGDLFNYLEFDIRNMVISCTGCNSSTFPDPYINQSPTPQSFSYAGMELHDIAATIGNSVNDPIELIDLNNGILSFNSTLLIKNTTFLNIQKSYGGLFSGCGIVARKTNANNSSIIQVGLGISAGPTFENCNKGIWAFNSSLDISENIMTDMDHGIQYVGGLGKTIRIKNNDITCKYMGIGSYYANFAMENNISFNTINVDGPTYYPSSACINIYENGFQGNNNSLFIDQNNLTVTVGGKGIALSSTAQARVNNNTITLTDVANDVSGIDILSSKRAHIFENTIVGDASTGNYQKAISTVSTTSSYITGNSTDMTLWGLYFDEDCDASYMSCNTIGEHSWGTLIDTDGKFGHEHILRWNTWVDDIDLYPQWGFKHQGLNAAFELFYANDLVSSGGDPSTSPPSADPAFVIIPGANHCDDDPNPNGFQVFDTIDIMVAQRSLEVEEFETEYNYMAKMNLYYKCVLFPDSIPEDSPIDSFYIANQNTTIGKFIELDQLSLELFSLQNANMQSVKSNDSIASLLLNQIAKNDSILYDGIPSSDSLVLLEDNKILKNSLYLLMKSNQVIVSIIDSLHVIYSDSLLSKNSAISVSTVIEQNQKDLNHVYYSTITKGIFTFDSLQLVTIFNIASQCIREGGKAVPIARGIYKMLNDTIDFELEYNCEAPTPRFAKTNGADFEDSYVYPNPSSYAATLRYKLPENSNGLFLVYDVLSRLDSSIPLDSQKSELRFSSENLNTGIYYYKIISNGNLISFGKFSIVR